MHAGSLLTRLSLSPVVPRPSVRLSILHEDSSSSSHFFSPRIIAPTFFQHGSFLPARSPLPPSGAWEFKATSPPLGSLLPCCG